MWAGFVGQFRLAAHLGAQRRRDCRSWCARSYRPSRSTRHRDASATSREHPYLATRVSYTRRAFAVDLIGRADSTIGFPSMAAALPWVSAWDPPALARAIDAGRANGRSKRSSRVARVARRFARRRRAIRRRRARRCARRGRLRTLSRPAPTSAERRCVSAHSRAGDRRHADRGAARVSRRAAVRRRSRFADSLNHTVGTPLESIWRRLASAWSLQNIRDSLRTAAAAASDAHLASRHSRSRIERSCRSSRKDGRVEPLLVGDSLYWGIDLYSASSTCIRSAGAPCSLGEDRTYFRHAAVAIVQASTGDISVVPDSSLDPIASTWVHRLPSIFGTWNALPPGFARLLPPPIDGLYAQANAFGRYGQQTDECSAAAHARRSTEPTRASSATIFRSCCRARRRPRSRCRWSTTPDRLRGLLIGTGGANRLTTWYRWPRQVRAGPPCSIVFDRSTAPAAPRATGRSRMDACAPIPLRTGVGFVQPTYRWRPQSVPTLNRLAILVGDSTRSIAPVTASPRRRSTGRAAGDRHDNVGAVAVQRDARRAAPRRLGRVRTRVRRAGPRARGKENPVSDSVATHAASQDRGHRARRQRARSDRRAVNGLRSVPPHARKPRSDCRAGARRMERVRRPRQRSAGRRRARAQRDRARRGESAPARRARGGDSGLDRLYDSAIVGERAHASAAAREASRRSSRRSKSTPRPGAPQSDEIHRARVVARTRAAAARRKGTS